MLGPLELLDNFVALSWLSCALTALLLFGSVWRRRWLILKPSMIVLLAYHVFIQWTATLKAREILAFLPDPLAFGVLVHGFPLLGFLLTGWTGRPTAARLWYRLQNAKSDERTHRRAAAILVTAGAAVVAAYLAQVPFQRTGLYAVLFDPSNAGLAREQSLKLLGSAPLRYAYTLYISSIAPLLVVLLAQRTARHLRKGELMSAVVPLSLLAVTIGAASLTGARSTMAFLLMAVALAWLIRRGLPFNPTYAVAGGMVLLTIPTVLTMMREGLDMTFATFSVYLGRFVVVRVLDSPFETALWFCHYAQTHGFFGIRGIPKLALLLGVDPVDAPNRIGLAYMDFRNIDSVSANTGYVFAYYACFGLASLVPSLGALWMLDLALLWYERIRDSLLLPCVAAASVSCVSFCFSEYTTVLFSGGFAVLLVLGTSLSYAAAHAAQTLRDVSATPA